VQAAETVPLRHLKPSQLVESQAGLSTEISSAQTTAVQSSPAVSTVQSAEAKVSQLAEASMFS
jgi:hypothetical protein